MTIQNLTLRHSGIIVTLATIFILLAVSITISPASSAQIDAGLSAAAQGGGLEQGADVDGIVANIVNLFLYVVGVVAVIMMIFGGFQFLTSAGDSSKAAKARSTIIYSIIGLVVAVLAYAIINFVMTKIAA